MAIAEVSGPGFLFFSKFENEVFKIKNCKNLRKRLKKRFYAWAKGSFREVCLSKNFILRFPWRGLEGRP